MALEANFRLTGRCVGRALDQAALMRWLAPSDHCRQRHGVHVQGARRVGLATRCEARLHTPRQAHGDNGLIESFNGRLRDEFLNVHEFVAMHDVREKLKAWQEDCNTGRPHGSLGRLTPSEFVNMRSVQQAESCLTPVLS